MGAGVGSGGGEGALMDENPSDDPYVCEPLHGSHPRGDGTDRVPPALEDANVLSNEPVADDVWLMRLSAPRTAATARPGQFAHVRLSQERDSVLRVPLSFFAATPSEGTISLLYQVLGASTRLMSQMRRGEACDLIGPIGRGWLDRRAPAATIFEPRRAILVAGGLGVAPLATLAENLAATGCRVDVVVGARTTSRIAARERLETVCPDLSIATDDGSEGYHGLITHLVSERLATHVPEDPYDYCAICGPAPMEVAAAHLVQGTGIYAEVSTERLMACGVGACLSCVVPTTRGLVRSCVEGPVFSVEEVVWDEL